MAARRRRPTRRPARTARRGGPPARSAAPRPPRPPPFPLPTLIPPEPTAHAICRRCGRIVRIGLPAPEVAVLQAFVDRRPDGWSIEGMSVSFTGSCPNCRPIGAGAPDDPSRGSTGRPE